VILEKEKFEAKVTEKNLKVAEKKETLEKNSDKKDADISTPTNSNNLIILGPPDPTTEQQQLIKVYLHN
jgi:hypothetical protein